MKHDNLGDIMRLFVILLVFAHLSAALSFAQQSDCDYKAEIQLDSHEFTKENFTWRMKATKIEGIATNITGTAKIELGNEIIKSYKPWTNLSISKQKTSNVYSPNLEQGEYKITAEITVECNDMDINNNIDVKTLKIIGQNADEIPNLNDGMIKTQQKTQQQAAQEQAVQANETQNATNNKTTNIEGQKNQTQAQNAAAVSMEEEFDNVINLKKGFEEEQDNVDTKYDVAYESSNEKAKEIIIYSILGLSVLVNIVLIWRR